ncbi:hypothetical protein D3C87_1668350 [compost metagenome]
MAVRLWVWLGYFVALLVGCNEILRIQHVQDFHIRLLSKKLIFKKLLIAAHFGGVVSAQ